MKKMINRIIFLAIFLISTNASAHYIGEQYAGGIIFWIDNDSEHGLIAATEDLAKDITWFNGKYITTYAIRDGIFSGKDNTAQIIRMLGSSKKTYAAAIAYSYRGGELTDWYLPSKYELKLLYEQKMVIGGFTDGIYWSSTELNQNPLLGVCVQNFENGDQFVSLKEYTANIRPIRSF